MLDVDSSASEVRTDIGEDVTLLAVPDALLPEPSVLGRASDADDEGEIASSPMSLPPAVLPVVDRIPRFHMMSTLILASGGRANRG